MLYMIWPRPFYGWFAIRGLSLAMNNLSTKSEVFISSTHYEDMKGDTKCRKWYWPRIRNAPLVSTFIFHWWMQGHVCNNIGVLLYILQEACVQDTKCCIDCSMVVVVCYLSQRWRREIEFVCLFNKTRLRSCAIDFHWLCVCCAALPRL